MTNQHPIVPPPDLIGNWLSKHYGINYEDVAERDCDLITRAAQWGADRELEACCEWIAAYPWLDHPELLIKQLRAARRPKPPSLKEQALAELAEWENVMEIAPDSPIRRALEQLDD